MSRNALQAAGVNQLAQVRLANEAVCDLMGLWAGDTEPKFLDVLRSIAKTGLFEIPEVLMPFAFAAPEDGSDGDQSVEIESPDGETETLEAIRNFLNSSFSQIAPYVEYVTGRAAFGTHQGVKGLEFPRVLVLMDDEEARGFLFSYEKLFGAKDKTKHDVDSEKAGKETGIDHTRRLFYVTCSRTEQSLAIVAYTAKPDQVRCCRFDGQPDN